MKAKGLKIKGLLTGTILVAGMTAIPLLGVTAFTETAEAATRNTWVYDKKMGGHVYYGSDGKVYKGWHYMTSKEGEKKPHWSYFGKNGKLYTGWKKMGKAEGEKSEHYSYFGPDGWLRTGWQKMSTASNPDGKNAQHWSYFGPDGWLRTGWQNMGKGTSNPDGKNDKHTSYFGENGWLRTGTQKISGKIYNFNSSGWLVNAQNVIGASKAKSIALSHAKLSASRIYGYKCELDWEKGIYVYEIDFKSGRYEYEYDINAYTGKIVKFNKEYDD